MEKNILLRLTFLLAITILLLTIKKNHRIEYFQEQTWSIKEALPIYWAIVFITVIGLFLSKDISPSRLSIIVSYIHTFLVGFILFVPVILIIYKRRLAFTVLGFKKCDVYWFLIFFVIQFSILIVLLFVVKSPKSYSHTLWGLSLISITIVFWPIIEEVLYLGIMFIPVSRLVGLKAGAVLVSLLRTLVHFNNNIPELMTNFALFGLLGCYLYIKAKRIIVPVILHSFINFFVSLREIV